MNVHHLKYPPRVIFTSFALYIFLTLNNFIYIYFCLLEGFNFIFLIFSSKKKTKNYSLSSHILYAFILPRWLLLVRSCCWYKNDNIKWYAPAYMPRNFNFFLFFFCFLIYEILEFLASTIFFFVLFVVSIIFNNFIFFICNFRMYLI